VSKHLISVPVETISPVLNHHRMTSPSKW